MQIYLVGGAVRDMLLGRHPREYDYVFSGSLDDFLARYTHARKAGTQFHVAICDGVEFAPMRGNSIHEDLAARDFTINAMAIDDTGRFFSHPQALKDLAASRIALAAPDALAGDPARIFRAARLTATHPKLHITPELQTAMHVTARSGALLHLAPERLCNEIYKLLQAAKPGNFLRALHAAQCLEYCLPEFFSPCFCAHDNANIHQTSDIMDKSTGDPMLVWMALCHNLGAGVQKNTQTTRHSAREQAARGLSARIKASNSHTRAAAMAVRCCEGVRYPTLLPSDKISLLTPLHTADLLPRFFRLVALVSGHDFTLQAKDDLQRILQVTLKPEERDRGALSGRLLHEKRCDALRR